MGNPHGGPVGPGVKGHGNKAEKTGLDSVNKERVKQLEKILEEFDSGQLTAAEASIAEIAKFPTQPPETTPPTEVVGEPLSPTPPEVVP